MTVKKSPRVVVVTGASGGIGRASARMFAEKGDHVALLARGITGLEAAAREVRDLGGTALPISVDTADHQALERAADRVETELGSIDVWVNDAFTSVFARFIDIEPEEFRRVTEVTYLGFVNGTRTALRRMLPRDSGVIVQVGSALGHRGIPLQSPYCGAKHAMWGFHESLLTELRHDHSNVHVTSVQMPGVNTPQFTWVLSKLPKQAQPVPPFYQPEVAARGSCSPPTTPSAAPTGSASPPPGPSSPTASPVAFSTATWPAPGWPPSRPPRKSRPISRPTSGSPPTARTDGTSVQAAPSATGPWPTLRSNGPPNTAAPCP